MMKPITGRLLALAATNGLIATMLAALGNHALKTSLSEQALAWFNMGAIMQMATTIALLGAALLGEHGRKGWANKSAAASGLGILFFSGSLYMLALSEPNGIGGFHWLTPLGGGLLMLGWWLLAIGAFRSSRGFRG